MEKSTEPHGKPFTYRKSAGFPARNLVVVLLVCFPALLVCSTLIPNDSSSEEETEIQQEAVQVFFELSRDPSEQVPITSGGNIELIASFDPVLHYQVFDQQGQTVRSGFAPRDLHNIQDFRFCVAPDSPCPLDSDWETFRLEEVFQLEVDWSGEKTFWFVAEFRNREGQIMHAFHQPDTLEDRLRLPLTINSE